MTARRLARAVRRSARRFARAAAAGALVLAALAGPWPTAAQDADSVAQVRRREQLQREAEARRLELERVEREAREAKQQAQQLRGREGQALNQLRRTNTELRQTTRRLRKLQGRRQSLDHELDVTRVTLERETVARGQQKALLARRLRALYKLGPGRELEFLLSTQSFATLLARWDFLVMVAEQDRILLEDITDRTERIQVAEQRLETNLERIARTEKETSQVRGKLDRQRAERQSSLSQIRTQRQAFEAAAAELEKTARTLRNLITRLERQRREQEQKAKAEGRAPEPYSGNFAAGKGQLDWPVRGEVVGRYGRETHPRFPNVAIFNPGIHIACDVGTPVRSVAKGRVDYVSEDFASFGAIVLINHGDGFYTMYGHLSEIHVQVGQEIASGGSVGRSGDSGTPLKGAGLHFEVREGASAVDPLGWLR